MGSSTAPENTASPSAPDSPLTAALSQLYRLMSARRRRHFHLVLLLMLAGAFAELFTIGAVVPFLSLLANQSVSEHIPWLGAVFEGLGAATREQQLIAATALFMVAAVTAGALRLWLAWASQRFVLFLGHELGVEIQRRILLQPYSYHVSHNSSEIVASLEKVQTLVFGVLLQLMQAAAAVVISLFIIAALVQVEPLIAAAAAITIGAIYAIVTAVTRRRLAANSAVVGSAYDQRIRMIQESVGGIRDVIIGDSQSVYVAAFRDTDLRLTVARANTAFIGSAPRYIIEATGLVVIAALALSLAGREGGLSPALPILGALAIGAQRLLPLIQQFYHGWTLIAGNRSIVTQVLDLLRLPVPARHSVQSRGDPLPFDDRIRFESVSFTYAGRLKPALVDIDLTIPRGARLALVGRTGSGKSTLADLLMGLLEPTEGRITVDGVPLVGETRRAWQRSIAHVPQAIFLADASIARNIAFGVAPADIDMQRVREAATTAQLHDFLASLPDGYDTPAGERGVRLSGGQRQRLGIARAIYKQAPVLVLDEATSSLDRETEAAVLRTLDALHDQGRTIVIIAHRQSTVEGCDIVVRIEGGRIAKAGTFAEILGS